MERRARCPQPGGQPPQEGSSELERDSKAGPVLRLLLTHFASGEEVLLSTSKRKFKYNKMERAVATGDLYHFLPQCAGPQQAPRFTRAPCRARLLGGWLSAHRCCSTASEGSWSRAGAPAHLPPPQYQGLYIGALMEPLHVTLWIQERCEPTQ